MHKIGLYLCALLCACQVRTPSSTQPPSPATASGQETQQHAARIRLTPKLLESLQGQIPLFLATAGTLTHNRWTYALDNVDIPGSSFQLKPGSSLSIDTEDLSRNTSLRWLAGSTPTVHVEISNTDVFLDVAFALRTSFLSTACRITDTGSAGTLRIQRLSFDLSLEESAAGLASRLRNLALVLPGAAQPQAHFNVHACNSSGAPSLCTDSLCMGPTSTCSAVCSTLDLLGDSGGLISYVARPVLEHSLPSIANVLADAVNQALAQVPTHLHASIPAPQAPLSHSAQPLRVNIEKNSLYTEGSGVGYGVNVGLNIGFGSSSRSACVPSFQYPSRAGRVFTPPFENGFMTQPNGALHRYQAGVSIAQDTLQQALEALFQAGWMCLHIDAEWLKRNTAEQPVALNAALLATLDSRITSWAPSQAPLLVNIRPLLTPSLQLVHNGYGSSVELTLGSMEIGLALWVDDAATQLATFLTDISIEIELVQDGSKGMQLALRELQLSNITQTYNEIFPNRDLSAGLRAVADIVLGQVRNLTLPLSFDLASFVPGLSSSIAGIQHASAQGSEFPFMQMYMDLQEGSITP